MAAAVIMITFITLFLGTIILVQFPVLATEIYTVIGAFTGYVSDAMGIVWFFLPKNLTLTLIGIALAIELVKYGFMLFCWVYNHLKQ